MRLKTMHVATYPSFPTLPRDFARIFSTHHRMSHLPFQLIALHVTWRDNFRNRHFANCRCVYAV